MSTMTVPRCGCGRVLRQHELPKRKCLDCEAVDASLGGYVRERGPLKEYPLLPAEECMGKLCTFCQQKNTAERAEAMYHHNDGPRSTHWYAHASCEMQREYDKYEEWRDTRDGEGQ